MIPDSFSQTRNRIAEHGRPMRKKVGPDRLRRSHPLCHTSGIIAELSISATHCLIAPRRTGFCSGEYLIHPILSVSAPGVNSWDSRTCSLSAARRRGTWRRVRARSSRIRSTGKPWDAGNSRSAINRAEPPSPESDMLLRSVSSRVLWVCTCVRPTDPQDVPVGEQKCGAAPPSPRNGMLVARTTIGGSENLTPS